MFIGIPPMWRDESERMAWRRQAPLAWGLRILADWIGLGSLASLLVVAVALASQATTEGLEAGAWWALVLPAGGILGARVLHAAAHRRARQHAEQE